MQLVQVFDSWAGELAPHHFEEFALPPLQRIAAGVRAKLAAEGVPAVPMTLFPKGANAQLAALVDRAGYDVIGIDFIDDLNDFWGRLHVDIDCRTCGRGEREPVQDHIGICVWGCYQGGEGGC